MGANRFGMFETDGAELRLRPQDEQSPVEVGWGEGAASALMTLRRLEQSRQLLQPLE